MDRTAKAEELLRELGGRARLVVYVASAPGSGKTRRLLEDARRLSADGKRVLIGWIETKGRPDLERLADDLPRVPPRRIAIGDATFEDFDYEAALREKPDVVVLDELAHDNLGDAPHAKRWQDALALKERGIGVIAAFNIAHLETVAPTAEALLGYPIREIVPLSFLQRADEVVALDVSPRLLQSRVRAGKIVNEQDIERALNGAFKETTLHMLRELLLRTVDNLTLPVVQADRTSMAAAFVYPNFDATAFLRRTAAIAEGLDLRLEVIPTPGVDRAGLEAVARELGGEILHETIDPSAPSGQTLRAALVALPHGRIATKLANAPLLYDLFIVGVGQTYLGENPARSPYSQTAGDRLRVGYGKLTVYLGAAAGAGKTYAMLDRAHQLAAEGIDVVVGFVETHGRKETAALLEGLDIIPEKIVNENGIVYRGARSQRRDCPQAAGCAHRRARAHQRPRFDRPETLSRRSRRVACGHRRNHDAQHSTPRRPGRYGPAPDRDHRARDLAGRNPLARRRGHSGRRHTGDAAPAAARGQDLSARAV